MGISFARLGYALIQIENHVIIFTHFNLWVDNLALTYQQEQTQH